MLALYFESETSISEALFFPLLVVIIFEGIRKSFYYISLGTLNPKSNVSFTEKVSKLIGKKRMSSVATMSLFLQMVLFVLFISSLGESMKLSLFIIIIFVLTSYGSYKLKRGNPNEFEIAGQCVQKDIVGLRKEFLIYGTLAILSAILLAYLLTMI